MKFPAVLIALTLVIGLGVRSSGAISFQDIAKNIGKGVGFANQLLGESGEVPRGKGCVVKWNISGTIRGIEWKWVCTCIDPCTGTVEVQTKQSREGAMEHCFSRLFQKLAQRGDL